MKEGENMTEQEILDARPRKLGGRKRTKGRPKKVEINKPEKTEKNKSIVDNEFANLTPRQAKFVTHYLETDNASKSAIMAGYSEKTNINTILSDKNVKEIITRKRNELWDMFVNVAEEALMTQVMIMRSEDASFKTRLDATNSLLDRAGLKPAERKEITGADGGAIQTESRVVNELAIRARELLVQKTIDIEAISE